MLLGKHKSNLKRLNQTHFLKEKVKILTEKLLESFEELNILYDINKQLINLYNIKDICDITLDQIAEVVLCEKMAVSLVDKEHLTIISCHGFVNNPAGRNFRIKNTLYDKVIKCQKPLLIENKEVPFPPARKTVKYAAGASSILHPACILPLINNKEVIGTISLSRKVNSQLFTARDIKFLFTISSQVAVIIQNARLITNLKESFLITVRSLSAAIDAKDPYTHGHSERVSKYALAIGKILGVPQEDLECLELSSLLHDVGKIGIPEWILNKKETLLPEEVEIIRKHPLKGFEILKNTNYAKSILAAVRSHHEKYNGQGYPDGLTQEQIPFLARIIAVADSYDAMMSDRPYRSKCSQEKAIEAIQKGSGSQYDPKVVWAFNKCIKRWRFPA